MPPGQPNTSSVAHSDDEPMLDTFRARVNRIFGEPSDSQLELIRAQMVDPSVIDDGGVFVFGVEATNNLLDSYFTRMHETSLRNYADDAKNGISFMNSHRTGGMITDAEQAYGRSFDGKFIGAGGRGNAKQRTDEWFYIPRGATPNGPAATSAEDMITAIRSGTGKDISISFFGGQWRCSICDRDLLTDWSCMHLPGFSYKPLDKDGKPQDTDERVTAVAWVWDAHQTEASSVYDGATPDAMVKKALRMAAEGILKPRSVEMVEQRYRINLPHRSSHAGVDIPEEGHDMPPESRANNDAQQQQPPSNPTPPPPNPETPPKSTPADGLSGVRQALGVRGITQDSSVADIELMVRSMIDENRTQSERLAQLDTPEIRTLIEQGRSYGEHLRTEAMEQGVRAMGADFQQETYAELFKTASLDSIKRLRDDWQRKADAAIPAGRTTAEAPERSKNGVAGRETPDAAYRTRS